MILFCLQNLLFTDISEEAGIKIVDFGFVRLKREKQPVHTPCSTLLYAAHAVLKESFSYGTDGCDENCFTDLLCMPYTMQCIVDGIHNKSVKP
jgi:serine/threonine protein kinase